ncbi:MAG: EamA family transporter [Acidobacteriia bacterium]|nr:EamA family transporter [Terriglobia bacterium]
MLTWCMGPNTRAWREREPDLLGLLLAFAAIYFVWGSTFLAIRFAVETLPPLLMMGTRHLVAGLLLFTWQRARGRWRPEPRLWFAALFSGAFCFLGCHGLIAWAEVRVSSGLTALLSATLPVWMVLLARIRGQQSELTPKVLSGIALGFVGVAVLMPLGFMGRGWEEVSAIAILVAEIFWAVGAIHARGIKTTTPPSTFAAMQMLCGGALLWAVGLGFGEASRLHAEAFTMRSVLSLAFLILFGSLLTFTAYTWLLQTSSPALVSTHSYVNPLVAVFLGWALASERVTFGTLAGAGIILASVWLLSLRTRRVAGRADEATEACGAVARRGV